MQAQAQAQTTIYKAFYTFKQTFEILEGMNISVKSVERVTYHAKNGRELNCILAVYKTKTGQRCATFISCRLFLAASMMRRRERSTEYKVTQHAVNGSIFNVSQKDSTSQGYQVNASQTGIFCGCEDFNNQMNVFSQHRYLWEVVCKQYRICKHGFATLNELGFDSLREYLQSWKPGGRLLNLSAKMNIQGSRGYSKSLDLTPA